MSHRAVRVLVRNGLREKNNNNKKPKNKKTKEITRKTRSRKYYRPLEPLCVEMRLPQKE